MTNKTYVCVEYIGMQQDEYRGNYKLYNLLEPMGEHVVYSTVSHNTIVNAGFIPFVTKVRANRSIQPLTRD
jgi:hypothetical protein